MDLLICLLTKKPASEKYYEVCGWIISAVISVIFINEMYFVIVMQIQTFKKLYKKFKPKFDEWRAKRKLKANKNKVVDEKEQLSAQVLNDQFSGSGITIDPKAQSLTAESASPSPTKRAGSPFKFNPRKVFPVSDASTSLATVGLFGEQNEKVFRKRQHRRITGFDSNLRFDSFGGTPTHTSQADTPSAAIPIIGGVESAFYNGQKPSSPINSIDNTNQIEEKNNLLEF